MRYDLIVIGGGSAGLVAAKFARGMGKRVAIIEKKQTWRRLHSFRLCPKQGIAQDITYGSEHQRT